MRILGRYVLKEYLIPLGYCLGGFISIYVLFELFGSFSRLMAAKLPLRTTAEYFSAYLAPYFEWLAPAALMLAALYTMWSFCRHSELIAMRANGIGFLTIVRPILLVATLMALFVYWVNDRYVPRRAQWARQMRLCHFDRAEVAKAANIVYRNPVDSRTWTVARVEDPDARHLRDVKVTVDRPGGARSYAVTAAAADYLDGEWWFTEPSVQHYDARGGEIATPTPALDALKLRNFAEFTERPEDFLMQNREWAYNSIADRLRYLQTHPDLSEDARRKFRYDIWAKVLSPFACIVITLFAIPAGIASGRQSVFRGVLGALGMFFFFYLLVIGGMIAVGWPWMPPLVAAGAPYVVMLALGIRAFRRNR